MTRTLLKSKLHRATVTEANLHYEGSLTIDTGLMRRADIRPFEEVHVWNVTRGSRLVTYAIEGGPGVFCVNGAGAHLVHPGDLIIVATFAAYTEAEAAGHEPTVLILDDENRVKGGA